MVLQLHTDLCFFLFITSAACVGIQAFSRKVGADISRGLQNDFPIAIFLKWLACWPLSWKGDKKHLSVFWLAWPTPQWIAMSITILGHVLQVSQPAAKDCSTSY